MKKFFRYEAADLVQEARLVAQVVDGYGQDKSIAVTMRILDRRTLIFEDALLAHGLEIKVTALPDMLGKEFDLVVIVDAAHGRLTLPREPLWFLSACRAAREKLLITSSLLDDRYQAQATSELVKLKWLGEPGDIQQFKRPLSKLETSPRTPLQQLERGKIDTKIFRERFKDKLGLTAEKPLSATRIEAFARCKFRAFIERLLEIDLKPASGFDIEPRLLGQLAHGVLEKYYSSKTDLSAAFQIESERALKEHPEVHTGVWNAMMLWLHEALKRLVSNCEKNPPIPEAKPIYFEKKLGPVPIQIGTDQIFLGGVADRIDKSSDSQIVIDYKLSSLSSLRMRFAPKEILKTQFQIPIYLKLLTSLPDQSPSPLGGEGFRVRSIGYPLSIKDGTPGPLIDMTNRFKELDQALVALLEPVLQGYVPADPESCGDCRLKRLCRV